MPSTSGHDWAKRLADRLSLREARRFDGRAWTSVRRERLVFTHVPKCGGTSFDSFLASFFRADELLPPRLQILGPEHWTEADLRRCRYLHGGHCYDDVRTVANAHFVTLLRDPLERIVSLYWHLRRADDLSDQIPEKTEVRRVLRDLAQRMTFEEWVREPWRTLGAYQRNVYVSHLTGGHKPLVQATAAERAQIAERACAVLAEEYVFFGLVEDYAGSKRLFCRTFGLPEHFAEGVERYNVAANRPARQPLDDETLSIIQAENAEDFALYRFARELFARRCAACEARPCDSIERPPASVPGRGTGRARGRRLIPAADLRGTGVHPEEPGDSAASRRWLGGPAGAQISIAADIPPHSELTVQLAVSDVATNAAFSGLQVRFDGAPSLRRRKSPWHTTPAGLIYRARFRVTEEMAARPIHLLTIDGPSEVLSELSAESTDDRTLSCAVQGVELKWRPFPGLRERLQRWVAGRLHKWRQRRRNAA